MALLKPLHNFPLVRSRDIEEVREAMARVYSRPVLTSMGSADGFKATVNNCQIRSIHLAYATYGTDVELDFPAHGVFSQLFPIRGTGEVVRGRSSAALSPGASAIASAGAPHSVHLSADYEHLVMRVDVQSLIDKLRALTGAAIDEPLQIDLCQDFKHPAALMLLDYLPLLVATLTEACLPFPDWWVAQTEQFLTTLFLCGHRHNYSHLLENDVRDASLRQVRQVEEYVEANAQQVITLEDLAALTGVSVFSLFRAFKKHRDYSPLQFLARVRSRPGGTSR